MLILLTTEPYKHKFPVFTFFSHWKKIFLFFLKFFSENFFPQTLGDTSSLSNRAHAQTTWNLLWLHGGNLHTVHRQQHLCWHKQQRCKHRRTQNRDSGLCVWGGRSLTWEDKRSKHPWHNDETYWNMHASRRVPLLSSSVVLQMLFFLLDLPTTEIHRCPLSLLLSGRLPGCQLGCICIPTRGLHWRCIQSGANCSRWTTRRAFFFFSFAENSISLFSPRTTAHRGTSTLHDRRRRGASALLALADDSVGPVKQSEPCFFFSFCPLLLSCSKSSAPFPSPAPSPAPWLPPWVDQG